MNNDTLNPNFEWKKKSFGKRERLSRRIDANQAEVFAARKKDNFAPSLSITASSADKLSRNLKNLHKKIKDALDEDEDDDDFVAAAIETFELENELNNNPLFQIMSDTEKRTLRQQQTLQEIKMQQQAAKTAALAALNSLAKQAGLPKLSPTCIAENMQNNGWGKETFKTALEHNIAPDIKTGYLRPDAEKIKKLMKGLKRLKKIGGFNAVQGMKINDVIHITDTKFDDAKVAKLLLNKTGRKPNQSQDRKAERRRNQPKVSFKKLLRARQEQKTMKV